METHGDLVSIVLSAWAIVVLGLTIWRTLRVRATGKLQRRKPELSVRSLLIVFVIAAVAFGLVYVTGWSIYYGAILAPQNVRTSLYFHMATEPLLFWGCVAFLLAMAGVLSATTLAIFALLLAPEGWLYADPLAESGRLRPDMPAAASRSRNSASAGSVMPDTPDSGKPYLSVFVFYLALFWGACAYFHRGAVFYAISVLAAMSGAIGALGRARDSSQVMPQWLAITMWIPLSAILLLVGGYVVQHEWEHPGDLFKPRPQATRR